MIPAGTYFARAVASGIQWGYTRNGNTQIVVPFEIETSDSQDSRISWYGVFTDRTRDRVIESLRHCGFRGSNLEDLGPLDTRVSLVIEDIEYNGRTYPRIRWINAHGTGRAKLSQPMTPDEVRNFAAKMRSACGATAPTSVSTDDDIPF